MLPRRAADEPALSELRRWIEASIGFVVQDDQLDGFAMKVGQATEALGYETVAELAQAVRAGQVEAQRRMVDSIAVNHTSFFREQAVIDVFDREVVQNRQAGHPFRVWSAASSTGQELYSLAMVMLRRWGDTRFRSEARLMGTDISGVALATATRGIFSSEQLARIPQAYQDLVETRGDKLIVSEVVRSHCSFRRLNLLASEWPFTQPLDVIFCRNVLYYFAREGAQDILRKMYAIAEPGGWLFTSSSEHLRDLDTGWVYGGPGVYRKERR